MKQKLLLSLLSIFTCQLIWAEDFTVTNSDGKEIYYKKLSSTTVAVTYKGSYPSNPSNEYYGTINIPSEVTYNGVSYTVTSIGKEAFYDCTGLTDVTIPESVTTINDGAFESCSGLTQVIIPNSVTTIGQGAFEDCNGLKSVTIGSSVTSIDYFVFFGCSKLKEIICLAIVPPTTTFFAFDDDHPTNCVLKVPEESIDLYRAADGWEDFLNIVAGIESTYEDATQTVALEVEGARVAVVGALSGQSVALYDIKGTQLYAGKTIADRFTIPYDCAKDTIYIVVVAGHPIKIIL